MWSIQFFQCLHDSVLSVFASLEDLTDLFSGEIRVIATTQTYFWEYFVW